MSDAGWSVAATTARLRAIWDDGRPAFGGWSLLRDPYAAELLAHGQVDWVCVDLQHGLAGDGDLTTILPALAITRTASFVRVPPGDPSAPGRALDAGANGVIVPMIESGVDARGAVAACRYAPAGTRSWGATRAWLGSGPPSPDDANDAVMCVVMIETVAGCEAAGDIAGTPGLDAIFVGPGDLAVSLGETPRLFPPPDAVQRRALEVRDACGQAGIPCGIFAGGAAAAEHWAAAGFAMIAVATDAMLIAEGVAATMSALRAPS